MYLGEGKAEIDAFYNRRTCGKLSSVICFKASFNLPSNFSVLKRMCIYVYRSVIEKRWEHIAMPVLVDYRLYFLRLEFISSNVQSQLERCSIYRLF